MEDAIRKVFGQKYIDDFHPADPEGNERLYRHQKAFVCNEFINRTGSKNKVFLDAGAGRGPYTFLASSKFEKVYCFEYDQTELEGAKSNVGVLPNVEFRQVDLRSIPLPDSSVGSIVCSEVLEHIPNEQKAATELFRVLKPGGRMLFSMPNNNSMFYRRVQLLEKIKRLKKQDPATLSFGDWEALRHVSFSYKDIENILTSAGFKIIDRKGVNIISLPGFFRKIFLRNHFLLKALSSFQNFISRFFSRYGSFYFLEVTK